MDGVETAESAEFFRTCSQVKRGEPRLKGAFKAGEKLQTKHWSSCPLLLTPALPQADHGQGPVDVPRGAALRWDWRDMVSPCPNGISYFFREGIMSSSWHRFPESSWPAKLVVTPVLHPFQDSESVSQALLSPKRFLNAFMMLVIPSSCLFPPEKQGLGLIKLCCQLSGSESWFALEHAFLAALMTVSHCQICAKQDLASASLERKHKFLLLFLSHSAQQLTTLLSRYPEFIKKKQKCNYPPYMSTRDRFLAGCTEDVLQNCCQQAAADVAHRIPFVACWKCAAGAPETPALGKASWGHSLISFLPDYNTRSAPAIIP